MESIDVDHFMDLLELLPWEPDKDGKGYHLPRGDLWDALDRSRWPYLTNVKIPYSRLRDGHRDASTVCATCCYMLDVFDKASAGVSTAIGALIVKPLGLDPAISGTSAGRRWCEDLASTAWRLVVPHAAEFRREARSSGD